MGKFLQTLLGEATEMSCTWLILTILHMYAIVRMSVLEDVTEVEVFKEEDTEVSGQGCDSD